MSFAWIMFCTKNGYKPVRFYKSGKACSCSICKKYVIYWWNLEGYADNGLEIYMGDVIDEKLTSKMLHISCKVLDKYKEHIFPREITIDEARRWYLGLLAKEYFNKLPEDLKESCLDFSNGRPLIKDDVMAAYIFKEHESWTACRVEDREHFSY